MIQFIIEDFLPLLRGQIKECHAPSVGFLTRDFSGLGVPEEVLEKALLIGREEPNVALPAMQIKVRCTGRSLSRHLSWNEAEKFFSG
jgi:hypothetical protein